MFRLIVNYIGTSALTLTILLSWSVVNAQSTISPVYETRIDPGNNGLILTSQFYHMDFKAKFTNKATGRTLNLSAYSSLYGLSALYGASQNLIFGAHLGWIEDKYDERGMTDTKVLAKYKLDLNRGMRLIFGVNLFLSFEDFESKTEFDADYNAIKHSGNNYSGGHTVEPVIALSIPNGLGSLHGEMAYAIRRERTLKYTSVDPNGTSESIDKGTGGNLFIVSLTQEVPIAGHKLGFGGSLISLEKSKTTDQATATTNRSRSFEYAKISAYYMATLGSNGNLIPSLSYLTNLTDRDEINIDGFLPVLAYSHTF